MDRRDHLLAHVDRSGYGIEVAPYFNPTLRKADGFNILIADVFDTSSLRKLATEDPFIDDARVTEIETVDLVGDASQLGDVLAERGELGDFDYVISSHNFEHLPDPIRFLKGVGAALKVGGVLSMAVPDYRACFDHFRSPSRLADWLDAYVHERKQPTPKQIFDSRSMSSPYILDGERSVGCFFGVDDPAGFEPEHGLDASYELYLKELEDPGAYTDCHCNLFFGQSLELLLRDLRRLGLIDLEVIEITGTHGLEFFAHLRKSDQPDTTPDAQFYAKRKELMEAVAYNVGRPIGRAGWRHRPKRHHGKALERAAKRGMNRLFGAERFRKLDRGWVRFRDRIAGKTGR